MIKILIVDDETKFCESLFNILKHRGYQVMVATEGGEALRIIREEHPAVILLDIKMPGINGMEVLRFTKSISGKIKVIIISGVIDDSARKETLALGANDFLAKPFRIEDLEAKIQGT